MKEALGHLKNHVKYPASKSEVIAACNQSSDLPEDREWLARVLPEGCYGSAIDVSRALLEKI
ncbi:MAG: hypothetical protein QXE96_07485 [Candidatus Caldarchaeum sp.]